MAAHLLQTGTDPLSVNVGASPHLSVESQTDNGIDPDDTALHYVASPKGRTPCAAVPTPPGQVGLPSQHCS